MPKRSAETSPKNMACQQKRAGILSQLHEASSRLTEWVKGFMWNMPRIQEATRNKEAEGFGSDAKEAFNHHAESGSCVQEEADDLRGAGRQDAEAIGNDVTPGPAESVIKLNLIAYFLVQWNYLVNFEIAEKMAGDVMKIVREGK